MPVNLLAFEANIFDASNAETSKPSFEKLIVSLPDPHPASNIQPPFLTKGRNLAYEEEASIEKVRSIKALAFSL